MTEETDQAYTERNRLVAVLARLWPAGIKRTDIPGWDAEWHNCVYIDLPTGQVSWHYHDRDAHLFADLPAYSGEWDGHTTEEKYRRLAASMFRSPPDPNAAKHDAPPWPAGCHDPNSCERHRVCMYHQCRHTGKGGALGAEIDAIANAPCSHCGKPADFHGPCPFGGCPLGADL